MKHFFKGDKHKQLLKTHIERFVIAWYSENLDKFG